MSELSPIIQQSVDRMEIVSGRFLLKPEAEATKSVYNRREFCMASMALDAERTHFRLLENPVNEYTNLQAYCFQYPPLTLSFHPK
jgi:hypothetical protein